MENNQVVLRKIPLKMFIEVLTKLWNDRADYVDIVGIPDKIQDNIGIVVHDDYYSKEGDEEMGFDKDGPLEDEDLDKLI